MDKKEPRIKFPFSNQTIFAMVMNDEGRCKAFLERIFPDKKVSEIKLSQNSFVEEENSARAEAEKMILNTPFHKSVRLDVLFEGDKSWYDIEFQSENTDDIPKRSRYYHSMIDTHILEPGEAYARLQPCYVIFLCRFDLFGKGKAVYQFQNYDIKNRLLLGDESYTIVLNSKAEAGSIPKELETLFSYINEGKVNPGRDDFIDEVHQKVLELNGDEKLMGVMTLEMDRRMREDWAEERGRREGLVQGRQEGLDLGRQEGLAQGIEQGIRAFVLSDRKDGISESEIKGKLIEWFNLSEEDAEAYIKKFTE